MSIGDKRLADNKKQQEGNEDGERGEETIKWEKHRQRERGHTLQARGKEREKGGQERRKRRRAETIIALSCRCTVINSLLVGESAAWLKPGLSDEPPSRVHAGYL